MYAIILVSGLSFIVTISTLPCESLQVAPYHLTLNVLNSLVFCVCLCVYELFHLSGMPFLLLLLVVFMCVRAM